MRLEVRHPMALAPVAVAALMVAACSGAITPPGPPDDTTPPPSGSQPQPPRGPQDSTPPGPGVTMSTPPPPFTPALAPLRRLTREQYDHTVRDLLGLDAAAATAFAGDEIDGGFASNARVALKELQVEQYTQAAEDLATRAVADLGKLAPCLAQPTPDAACPGTFVRQFGRRAFRRPLTPDEQQRYERLFAAGRDGGDVATASALVVQAMLQSPFFLYRPEPGLATAAGAKTIALSPHEVAARLSYLFWNSLPDDELFAAADKDELRTAEQIGKQARRLFAHEKARRTLASFTEQWLALGDLPITERNTALFPQFTTELRAAMREEVSRFVDDIVRAGDGRLDTLLTAQRSVINGPLATLYGLPAAADAKLWAPANLPAGQRAGLLSLPAVMTVHAHADQTSLVKRGFLVRAQLLCTVPPAAPPDVDNAPPKVDPTLSARVRFEQHRANPACAGCHTLMDPLGAPFEAYDPIGRYRTMDGKHPVDASGAVTGTAASDGPVADPRALMQRLATADEVRRCVVRQWFRFTHGRVEGPDDAATIQVVYDAFARSGFRVPELVTALATSEGFRTRRAAP